MYTIAHELTHFIQNWSPVDYEMLSSAVADVLGKDLDDLVEMKMKEEDLSRPAAYDEVIADSMQEALLNDKVLDKLSQKLHEENKGLWNKIKDWFKKSIEKIQTNYVDKEGGDELDLIRKADIRKMEHIYDIWVNGLIKASENSRKGVGKNIDQKNGQIMYNKKSFSEQVDDVINKVHNPRFDLYVSETPQYLIDLNFTDGPLLMRNSKIYEILDKHPEMSDTIIKQIPEAIQNPIFVLKSKTHPKESVVVITDIVTNRGAMIVPVWINQEGNYIDINLEEITKNTNFIASAYGRDVKSLFEYALKNDGILYENSDKNRVRNFLTRNGLQLSAPLKISNSEIILSENNSKSQHQNKKNSQEYMDLAKNPEKNADYEKPITIDDIKLLRSIISNHNEKRVSINDFTSEDIQKAQKWAYKFNKELGTKSPFFRAWFGDWRAYDKKNINIVHVPTIDITDALLEKGDYNITDTGWTVHAGNTLEGETRHHTGGEKVNVKSLNAIRSILENAVLFDTIVSDNDSNKKTKTTAFLHKLYSLTEYNGKKYIAVVTVEEFYNETLRAVSRKAYNLKSIKIESADGQLGINSSSPMSDTDSIINVSYLYSLVKQYDKDFRPGKTVHPALLNEDGTPKVFYHGTDAEFTAFDYSKGRSTMDIQGLFFSPWELDASGYGKNVGAYYLNIKNPAPEQVAYAALRKFQGQNNAGVKAREYLISQGYDGVNNSDEEFIAFYPEQIKSATDNIGTYDPKNPDIRFQAKKTDKNGVVAGKAEFGDVFYDINLEVDQILPHRKSASEIKGSTSFNSMQQSNTESQEKSSKIQSQQKIDRTLDRRNEYLSYRNERLREEIARLKADLKLDRKETQWSYITRKSAADIARSLMSEYDIPTKSGIGYKLTDAVFNLAHTLRENIGNGNTEEIMKELEKVTKLIRDNTDKTFIRDESAKEMLQTLRAKNFRLSEKQKQETVYGYGSYGAFYRQLFGSVGLADHNTMTLDEVWPELTEMNPALFPADTNEGDMPNVLLDAVNDLKETGYTKDSLFNQLVSDNDILDNVWDKVLNAEILVTTADKYSGEIKELKKEHRENMRELRAKRDSMVERTKEEGRNRLKRQRDRVKIAETKAKIRHISDDLQRRILRGNDRTSIPAGLTNAAIEVCLSVNYGYEDGTRVADKRSKVVDALSKLQVEYNKLDAVKDAEYIDEFSTGLMNDIAAISKNFEKKSIKDMSLDELTDVYNLMSEFRHGIMSAKKQIGINENITNKEAGTEIISWMNHLSDSGIGIFKDGKRTVGTDVSAFFRNWMTGCNLSASALMNIMVMQSGSLRLAVL